MLKWWKYRVCKDATERYILQRRPWWRFYKWETRQDWDRGQLIIVRYLTIEQAQNEMLAWHKILLLRRSWTPVITKSYGNKLKHLGLFK